ncbi:hypothetical protein NA56DRAFT_709653 [Hyaloscypha hepaticicola]|uniref:Uncharacterized protein n=1 Tax=Hyaloscypha hepaticicola TaxID=2082293 RepID=A0A2J6PNC1_9HELO|nr:hypothetical protein NA56DRAFT_709653 [Hyaloscypha hepaticicola]
MKIDPGLLKEDNEKQSTLKHGPSKHSKEVETSDGDSNDADSENSTIKAHSFVLPKEIEEPEDTEINPYWDDIFPTITRLNLNLLPAENKPPPKTTITAIAIHSYKIKMRLLSENFLRMVERSPGGRELAAKNQSFWVDSMKTCCMLVEKDFHILFKERLGSGSRTGEIRRRGRGREVLNVLPR